MGTNIRPTVNHVVRYAPEQLLSILAGLAFSLALVKLGAARRREQGLR